MGRRGSKPEISLLGSFLYYFPDRADTISRNHFNEADKKCGLDSILRDASLASNGPPSGGPGGSNGVLAMIVTNTWGGEWISEVKSEYAYLMADSEQALKDMQSANDKNYQEVFSRHMDFCTRMLGVNYHVGRHEVTILEALTTETFMLILRAAIGRLTFEREQEKQSAAADTIT
jgi:hypothetical protein